MLYSGLSTFLKMFRSFHNFCPGSIASLSLPNHTTRTFLIVIYFKESQNQYSLPIHIFALDLLMVPSLASQSVDFSRLIVFVLSFPGFYYLIIRKKFRKLRVTINKKRAENFLKLRLS